MLKFFNIKTNTLGKSAFILAFFTLTSQILAIIRDKIFAIKFGASIELDIYYAAFKIPHIVFLLTGTLISSFILIPFFEKKKEDGDDSLQNFIDKIFYTFIVLMIFVSILFFILIPQISTYFFPGFKGEDAIKFIKMSRIFLISPFFLGISNLFIGLNQKNSYFISTAVTGVFYNLSIILGLVVLYPFLGFNGVIIGVLSGSILYFLIQLPSIFKENLFPKKIKFFSLKESFDILKVSVPRSFALVISELLMVLLVSKASKLPEGSIVIIVFVLNIILVPVRLITISYSSASFPKMTRYFVNNEIDKLKELVKNIISKVFFFGIPVAFFFFFFSDIVVGFLLGSKKFGWLEIHTTALLISLISIIIIFQSISIIIIRIFYAVEKTKIALIVNSLVLVSFFIFYSILSIDYIYKKLEIIVPKIYFTEGIIGLLILIISYMFTSFLGSVLTFQLFKKYFKNFKLFSKTNWILKFFISFMAVFLSRICYQFLIGSIDNSFFEFTYSLIIAIVFSIIFFIFFAEIFKMEEYLDLKKNIKKEFLKLNK